MAKSQRRNRRISPYHIAERWCGLGEDQEGFEKKFINDDIGHGLVTNKPFLKGDFLLEYRGILSIADDQDDENADYVFHFSHKSTEYRIDASDSNSCLARWVNDDHVHPNSIMKKVAFDNNSPHLCLFALVDLKEGVELTYDYGVKNLPWRQPSLEKEKNIPSSPSLEKEKTIPSSPSLEKEKNIPSSVSIEILN
ncbi:histone-lysine N-methyltransferase PR-Set7-like [Strongylocentrotus purpuratus]|uniref:SET domain-containing protein n=1 Tax=Strongylocentrotus purpuratus TaxID=7668 RepID=A0A7M7NUK7_STRPU|nr:histone-lysine N-methyltransferase PR-Set7-like [Strongylocentrotus purpuratus]